MLYGWKENSMLAEPLAACTHLSSTVSQLFEPQVPKTAVFTYRSPHFSLETPLRLSRNMLHGWKENSMPSIYYRFWDTAIYLGKSRHFIIPVAFDAPLGGFPSENRHPLWDGKTRMVSLPEDEKISKISLFVLTWSTNVTDGRTDRRTDRQTDTAWQHRPRLHRIAR